MILSWWSALERRAVLLAGLAAATALAAGAYWGTYVAGGPDSYCYLNQAELFASGRVRDAQPIVQDAPWANRVETVVPVGHVAAPRGEIAVVPMCAPGYPIVLALARVVGGRAAMFWIVPIAGALAVWCTFLLGRRFAGAHAGLFAAVVLAASPAFLYQIVQPMSDVPAASAWAAALVVALGRPTLRQALVAGAATGAAVLVRPNLAPLGAVIAGMVVFATEDLAAQNPGRATRDDRRAGRALARLGAFVLGGVPFAIVLLALQNAMYGGPFMSGYGTLEHLFSMEHVLPNLKRYPVWLVQTQTWFIALSIVTILLPNFRRGAEMRRRAAWLGAFAAVTLACYLPYTVYDAWWFLRFLLPAFPPLIALACAGFVQFLSRPVNSTRVLVMLVTFVAVVFVQIATAIDGKAFDLHNFERRYRDTGEYIARRLPQNAVVITTQQSGSVRFYSGRPTLIWDVIDPQWLDRTLDYLRAKGRRPYFLFEMNEESLFRDRFGPRGGPGALEWPPAAQIDRDVRIYALEDMERFRRGENIETDFVWRERR